jgi:hypothetical protein
MLQLNIQTHTELLHIEAAPINFQLVTDFTGLLSRELFLG